MSNLKTKDFTRDVRRLGQESKSAYEDKSGVLTPTPARTYVLEEPYLSNEIYFAPFVSRHYYVIFPG